ncbi:MAG: HEPN domain-containing protein [Candidatus Edwardsbacteria bacterium]
MTTKHLAQSYLIKAEKRLKGLDILFQEEDYSDVVREAQEIVELCLKGMLRFVGIEPPKFHDVGFLIIEHKNRFKGVSLKDLRKITKISKELRKEREFAFYGDIDFIPTEEYSSKDARKAIRDAEFVLKIAKLVIPSSEK